MNYFEIAKQQIANGESVDSVLERASSLIDELGGMDNREIREFLFDMYESMNGKYINESLARRLVSHMEHVDAHGSIHTGELISPEKSLELISDKPHEYVEMHRWDAYVAANGFMYDLIRSGLNEEQKMRAAKEFWFNDDDFPEENKVYWYYKWLA